jgi:hypothetical protein
MIKQATVGGDISDKSLLQTWATTLLQKSFETTLHGVHHLTSSDTAGCNRLHLARTDTLTSSDTAGCNRLHLARTDTLTSSDTAGCNRVHLARTDTSQPERLHLSRSFGTTQYDRLHLARNF